MIKAWHVVFLLLFVGCGGVSKSSKAKVYKPTAILTEECRVCSMVVREQPSPRGQVIHRDGTRFFFCSISEMIQYIQVPSSHGKVIASWVEVMDPAISPKETSALARSWNPSEASFFVKGLKRKGIMGKAIMCFSTKKEASMFTKSFGGEETSLEELKKIFGQ